MPEAQKSEPQRDFGCPESKSLACTGLYGAQGTHWYSKTLGEGIQAYEPSATLCSDGMDKRRYVHFPPGSSIDAARPNDWLFPVGTQFWKEFAWQGKRIETRYLEKRDGTWFRTTYRWTSDEADAVELTTGQTNVPGTDGDSYEIPSTVTCDYCHDNGSDFVLGFNQIALATPGASGVTWRDLNQQHRIEPLLSPLALPGNQRAQAALSYLHANCGVSCHNDYSYSAAKWTGFVMKLDVNQLSRVEDTPTYRTGVGVGSYVPSLDGDETLPLIASGEPDRSAVVVRSGVRDDVWQMPPVATHVIDGQGLALLRAWISELPSQ